MSLLRAITLPPSLFLFLTTIAPLIVVKIAWYQQLLDFALSSPFINLQDPQANEEFEFIVVGGGSAGSAVAARLSENFRVLLLEAGGDPHPFSYVPILNTIMLGQPMVDWEYSTEALENAGFAFRDQRMPYPRARALGGCSNNNWMQYNRGNPNDYDLWGNMTGDERWNYHGVLKYFRRMENYHGHWKDSVGQLSMPDLEPGHFHGRKGPMHIEGITYEPALKYWLQAAEELGYPVTEDPNAIQSQGFGPFDVFQKNGKRFGTYRGYIVPNLLNKNLVIRRYCYATKIQFDETMRATGVFYLHHGVPKFAEASKEIILSAGAINTPQLLLLSGIGPTEHLLDVGIKPVVNLPVGLNLQDHVSAIVNFVMDSPLSLIPERDISLASVLEYVTTGKGVLSGDAALGGYGFVSTKRTSLDWPNIFYILTPTGNFKYSGKAQDMLGGYQNGNFWEQWLKPTEGKDGHIVYVLLGKTNSRGFIKLADANPMSKPIIQPAYFTDAGDEDIETLIDGVEFIVKLYEQTKAFQVAGAKLNPVPAPGCENYIFKSRRYYECLIRTHPQTIYHPSCTSRMGYKGDPNAVLDSELRVIGTSGLRVADTSAMPIITNANLNGPAIMIGERCADLIKSTWLTDRKSSKN